MQSKRKRKNLRPKTAPDKPGETILTFRQHFQELRKRIIYVVFSLGLWSIVTYIFERPTVRALLRPAKNQQFIYTSPIGGIDFMFRVSLYVAFILTLPVIVYNILAFIEPLLTRSSRRFIAFGAIASGVLAVCGLVFGYFVGLPSAMHFLLRQFVTSQIKPLLTIQSYLAFVMVYMLGSALMLQIPLILIFINRIKPLKPKRLLHYERWVILGAFIMSAIMDPTPNVLDLLVIAGPLILMYQVGILIIAFMNRNRHPGEQQPKAVTSPQPVAREQYAQPGQPAILRQFAEAPRQLSSRSAARPAQRVMGPAAPKAFDMVHRRAAKPANRRPVIGREQQLYLRKTWDEEAAA